jgi:prepilin-type N-terminal cleavage/methylation domain-containing protein
MMRRHCHRLRPRTVIASKCAYTLVELLVVIGIFAAFALVATQLMHRTILVGHDAGYAQIAATTFDAAGRVLRQDAWAAKEMSAKSDRAITLTLADGSTIEWSVDEAGTFTRAAKGEPPRKWETKAAGATLAADGVAVVVRLPQTKTARGGELQFTSQLMLAGRMTS